MNEWRTEFWGGGWTLIKGHNEGTRLVGFDTKTEAEEYVRSMSLFPPVERAALIKAAKRCTDCGGTGVIYAEDSSDEWECPTCKGQGKAN